MIEREREAEKERRALSVA